MTAATVIEFASGTVKALATRIMSYTDAVKSLIIHDEIAFHDADSMLGEIVALRKEVASTFDPIIAKAHAAHKEACDQKKRHDEPLRATEVAVKLLMDEYLAEQRRIAAEEQREREEQARKIAEAEQLAAAKAAEDAGDKQAAEAIIARPVHVAPPPAPELPKAAHSLQRTVWDFEVVSLEALVCHIAGVNKLARPELLGLIAADTKAIRLMVNALKSTFNIPGVNAWEEKKTAARGR